MSEISKTSQEFRQNLIRQVNDSHVSTLVEEEAHPPLVKCKRCGREDKFCQNCGTCSIHYRKYDGDHNTLVFEDGQWKIYMFSNLLCHIRPIHIKAILDSVKIQDRKELLNNNQLDMFFQTILDDLSLVIEKVEKNPNIDRLNDFIQVTALRNNLTSLKRKISDFEKINLIMDKGRIEE